MAMARTVASATSRTAATATCRITATAMAAATVTATAMATGTANSNIAINARTLLRRPYLGRAAAGKPPSWGSGYCCVGKKG